MGVRTGGVGGWGSRGGGWRWWEVGVEGRASGEWGGGGVGGGKWRMKRGREWEVGE